MKLRGPGNPITQTEREQIMKHFSDGKTYIEIADMLNRSRSAIFNVLHPKKSEDEGYFNCGKYLRSTSTI